MKTKVRSTQIIPVGLRFRGALLVTTALISFANGAQATTPAASDGFDTFSSSLTIGAATTYTGTNGSAGSDNPAGTGTDGQDGGLGVSFNGQNLKISGAAIGGNGGAGGSGIQGGNGGNGGVGLSVGGNNAQITVGSDGFLEGGTAGAGGIGTTTSGAGGAGGAGLDVTGTGVTIDNAGGIVGGEGGGLQSTFGAGVTGSNVTINNSGTISGGIDFLTDGYGDALDLTGTNTLNIEADSYLVGNINIDSGSLSFVQTDPQTIVNDITGTGSVIQAGPGTLTLTGDNTYSGGTTVQDGARLAIGADENLGAASNDLYLNQGTLQATDSFTLDQNVELQSGGGVIDTNGNSVSIATAIDGVGGLSKTGIGTLTLDGAESYTGPTNIDAGTLQLGEGTSIETSSAVALNSPQAILDISASGQNQTIKNLSGVSGSTVNLGSFSLTDTGGASTYAGTIQGSGGLIISGQGAVLTLSGDNTYTGGTKLENGGQLVVGAGGSIIGEVDNGGLITYAGSGNSTLATVLSGGGALEQTGTGLLTIDGNDSSFSGTTTVTSGGIEVGDAANPSTVLGGDVIVDQTAYLRGHGTIGGNLSNSGTVFPGGSIGVLTVNGNYTQAAGGILNIEVTPSVVPGVGYDKLQVNGVASVAGTLAFQVDPGTYKVGSIYDVLSAAGGLNGKFTTVTYSGSFYPYLSPQVTYTNDSVLLELYASPDSPTFSTGRIYAANSFVTDQALFTAGGSVLEASTKPQTWLDGIGSFGSANGYDINDKGFVVGRGALLMPDITVGMALSSIFTSTSGDGSTVDGNSDGVYAYTLYDHERLGASAFVGVGYLNANATRGLPGTGLNGDSSHNGFFDSAGARINYTFGGPKAYAMPYASAVYVHTSLGGATENGAGMFDLAYGGMRTDLAQVNVGVKTGMSYTTRYGVIAPWGSAGGNGTIGNTKVSNFEAVGLLSGDETANAAPAGALSLAAGVDFSKKGPWHVSAEWGGQYGSGSTVENFEIEGRYTF